MAVNVYIPTPFRRATGNRDRVDVERAGRRRRCSTSSRRAYGGLKGLVRNERGEVHQHVNIYVNSEAIDGARAAWPPRSRTATRWRSSRRSPAAPGQAR